MKKENSQITKSNCALNEMELDNVSGGRSERGSWGMDPFLVCPNCGGEFRTLSSVNIHETTYECSNCGAIKNEPKKGWENYVI